MTVALAPSRSCARALPLSTCSLKKFANYASFSLMRDGEGVYILEAGYDREGCVQAVQQLKAAADEAHAAHTSLYLSCHKYPDPL